MAPGPRTCSKSCGCSYLPYPAATHDGGFRPTECTQIQTWYSQMHLSLLIKCGGVPHNKLLTSLLNLFGDTRASFGDSRVDSSALKTPSLT